MTEESYRLPYIRLIPGQDDDLIAWLVTLEGEPLGVRGQRYKQIVREGLRVCGALPWVGEGRGLNGAGPGLDTEALVSDIRRVLEAVIESTLARGGVIVAGGEAGAPTAEATDWLETVMDGLLLGEEEGEDE